MSDITVSLINHDYNQQIQQISVDCFGMQTPIGQLYSFTFGAFVYDQNSQPNLVGFVHGYTERSKKEPAIIKTIAVDQQYQNHKIGFVLFGYAEDYIIQKRSPKSPTIIVPAWKHNNTINLQSILDKHDFKLTTTIKRPWKQQCDKNQIACPAKQSRCCCDLVWFTKYY